MSTEQSNNKRIAKNTLLLYFRMLLTTVISIYTSRILLDSLGVMDYGIYNVVGGVVGMLSFLNGSLASSSQRFITYSIGKGDKQEISATYTNVLYVHFILAILIIVACESVGLYLLHGHLNIPQDRMVSAQIAFHLSVLSMAISIISVPFNALIIAFERMSFFAYLSIYEVVMKLIIAFSIFYVSYDKLIVYAILTTVTQISLRMIYGVYCRRQFYEIRFLKVVSKDKIKQMLSFTSWNTFASLAVMLMMQGTNIILNIFFGPVVNAARSISQQVQAALTQLYSNFQMAINPQITKSYAQDNLEQMRYLMFSSVKISFVIMFTIALPFQFLCDYVLGIWLVSPPDYASEFIRIGLLINVIDAMANPFIIGCMATGRIRNMMIICGTMFCMVMPVSYLFFKLGFPPYYAYVSQFSISAIAFIIRLYIVNRLVHFGIMRFCGHIVLPILIVSTGSFFIVYMTSLLYADDGFVRFTTITLTSILSVGIMSFIFILDKREKNYIMVITKKTLNKIYDKKNIE